MVCSINIKFYKMTHIGPRRVWAINFLNFKKSKIENGRLPEKSINGHISATA